jgi:hypothetical protein
VLSGTADAAAEDHQQPEPTGGWLHGSISSLVSFVVHLSLLFLCALVVYDPTGGGPADQEVGIGRLPYVPLDQNVEERLDATALETQTVPEQLDEQLVRLAPAETAGGQESLEIGILGFRPGGGEGDFADMGKPLGGGGASDVATFMGVRATGRRFCIIADTSGSMAGPKLEFVKEEVQETIGSMKATARFQIVFFCSREIPYPKDGWLHPRKQYKDLQSWLKTLYGSGGTEPMTAFRVAFRLEPAPDVIFFMTDGLFRPDVVDEVAALQRSTRKQVVIHTISFMDRTAEVLMQEIARNSGGTYRHVAGF